MAVAVGSVGTALVGGTHTSSAVPVPASVANTDLLLVSLYTELQDTAITMPSGFAEIAYPSTLWNGSHQQRTFWKQATAADSGSYTFTHASTWTSGVAIRFTGVVTSGSPLEVLAAAQSAVSSTTTPSVTGTTTGAAEMVVHIGTSFNGSSTWTAPTGYTKQSPAGSAEVIVSTITQASAGSTGSVSATASAADVMSAGLLALLSVAVAVTVQKPQPGRMSARRRRASTW